MRSLVRYAIETTSQASSSIAAAAAISALAYSSVKAAKTGASTSSSGRGSISCVTSGAFAINGRRNCGLSSGRQFRRLILRSLASDSTMASQNGTEDSHDCTDARSALHRTL